MLSFHTIVNRPSLLLFTPKSTQSSTVASPSRPNNEKVIMKVSVIFGSYCGKNEPNLQRPLTFPKLQEACAEVLERRLSDRGDSDKGMGIVDFQTSFIISYFVGCAPAPKFYETRAKRGFASRCFLEPEDGIIDGIRAMLAASVVWLVILTMAGLNKSSFSSSRQATCKCHPISGK